MSKQRSYKMQVNLSYTFSWPIKNAKMFYSQIHAYMLIQMDTNLKTLFNIKHELHIFIIDRGVQNL